MNFFELRTFKHIKTVPLMDELEGILVLNDAHSKVIRNLKNSAKNVRTTLSDHIVITAGNKGIIRILRVTMNVRNIYALTFLNCSPPNFILNFF